MIESSFCLLSRVGPKTERRLWQRGDRNMDGVPLVGTIPGIGPSRKTVYDADWVKRRPIEHKRMRDISVISCRQVSTGASMNVSALGPYAEQFAGRPLGWHRYRRECASRPPVCRASRRKERRRR